VHGGVQREQTYADDPVENPARQRQDHHQGDDEADDELLDPGEDLVPVVHAALVLVHGGPGAPDHGLVLLLQPGLRAGQCLRLPGQPRGLRHGRIGVGPGGRPDAGHEVLDAFGLEGGVTVHAGVDAMVGQVVLLHRAADVAGRAHELLLEAGQALGCFLVEEAERPDALEECVRLGPATLQILHDQCRVQGATTGVRILRRVPARRRAGARQPGLYPRIEAVAENRLAQHRGGLVVVGGQLHDQLEQLETLLAQVRQAGPVALAQARVGAQELAVLGVEPAAHGLGLLDLGAGALVRVHDMAQGLVATQHLPSEDADQQRRHAGERYGQIAQAQVVEHGRRPIPWRKGNPFAPYRP
jgi:hypothetical protein